MKSAYLYYPRALRHFTELIDSVTEQQKKKTFYKSYSIHKIKDKGNVLRIKLKSSEALNDITITYYRLGFLIVEAGLEVEASTLEAIRDITWSFITGNSVVYFRDRISGAGITESQTTNGDRHLKGFTESTIKILNGMGDFTRNQFRELENERNRSPYRRFLKQVRSKDFSSLLVYLQRVNQIENGVLEFIELEKDKYEDSVELKNALSEIKYIRLLLQLALNHFEKEASHFKVQRDTFIIVLLTVLTCIIGAMAL